MVVRCEVFRTFTYVFESIHGLVDAETGDEFYNRVFQENRKFGITPTDR